MDNLPVEILLVIFELVGSLEDLISLRNVGQLFRNIVDQSCTRIAHKFARAHFDAFDDALLAVRVKRIPHELRCHYVQQQSAYSFAPSKEFYQAVMQGRPVPADCPSIPSLPWFEEFAEVMDLYLLGLAWQSTTAEEGINQAADYFVYGSENLDFTLAYAPQFREAYLRSFYRLCVFTSLFGPRVFVEPVLDTVEKVSKRHPEVEEKLNEKPEEGFREKIEKELDEKHAKLYKVSGGKDDDEHEDDIDDEVVQELRQYPIYQIISRLIRSVPMEIFKGFFEWLYAQPEPGNKRFDEPANNPSLEPPFSKEEREHVALLQSWKVTHYMFHRCMKRQPSDNEHMAPLFNPVYFSASLLPCTVYRPRLRLSRWSDPQEIIDHWAKSNTVCSIVMQPDYPKLAESALMSDVYNLDMEYAFEDLFKRKIRTEYLLKFGTIRRSRYEYRDLGLLNPLWKWVPPLRDRGG